MTTRRGKTLTQGVGRGAILGAGIGLLLAALLLLYLILLNPFLVDDLPLTLLMFVAPPCAAFAAIGALVGLLVVLARPGGGTRASGPAEGMRATRPGARRAAGSRLTAASLRFALTAAVLALVICVVGGVVSARVHGSPAKRPLKLLMVGIDGGTWRVASEMMKRGELPNLAAAVAAGSSGVLESTRPMYSTRIFTSIASGKTAEKHGVRGISDTRADDVLVKRVWEILNEQLGWDYGTVEWYLTWPPSASPGGFAIPGMLSAGTETIPPGLSFVRELREIGKIARERDLGQLLRVALNAASGGCRASTLAELASAALSRRASTPVETYHRQQMALVRVISDATRHEIRRSGVEMAAVLYKSTDSISHKYWRFHDPGSFPGIDPAEVERYGDAIHDVYALVDRELGSLTSYLAPDGILMAFSDHGFRASASLKSVPVSFKVETLLTGLGFSLRDVSYISMGGSFYLQPLTIDEVESSDLLGRIDEVFSSLTLQDSGEPAFFVEVVDKQGTGDDFVLITTTDALETSTDADPIVRASTGHSMHVSEFLTNMDISGMHALDGLIVLVGEPFRSGERLVGATVFDITPTALAALGLPVAEDMDGKVLTSAMTRSFLASRPVQTVDTYETEVRFPRRSAGVDSMSEETRERLRSLGYMQ
jgi:hypothetical protein